MTIREALLGKGFFPPDGEPIELEYSRYAGYLMLLYAAVHLGCLNAAAVLDVTGDADRHSHQERYLANFLAIASGKQRLSHVDELIPKEFELVCGGDYPKKSSNHEYMDQIVKKDEELVSKGQDSIIQKFQDETTKGYLKAGILNGENAYLDKHVIEVNTEKNIPKDLHGTKNTTVKAIDEYRALCADTKTPIFSWFLSAGQSFSKLVKPALEKAKSLTGKAVKLLGLDKGAYNYTELQKAAKETESCIVIWAKDLPKTLESLAAVSEESFDTYEKEVVKDPDGTEREVVTTSIADAGELIIDEQGHKVRTIVLQNEKTKRRVGILTFGKSAMEHDKYEIADFLYGKQNIENYFKERKKWGSDKFCGGLFKRVKVLPPSKTELCSMEKKLSSLDNKFSKLSKDLENYNALLEEGKLNKRDYNRLSNKAGKDIDNCNAQRETLKSRIEFGKQGLAFEEEPRHVLDTRKTAILSVLQDHVIVCRRFVLNIFRQGMEKVLLLRLKDSTVSMTQEKIQKVQNRIKNLNMQKMATRLFEQGGYIYRDDISHEFIVVMRNYEIPLVQEAYELLCHEFSKYNTYIEVVKEQYQLVFLTEDAFRKKYTKSKSTKVVRVA